MKKMLATAILVLFTTSGMAKDNKTVILTTSPQMHCESCENKLKNNRRFEKGIKRIDTNVDKQTVTIKYDADKITPAKIQEAFKKIGYNARELKENEKKSDTQQNDHDGIEQKK